VPLFSGELNLNGSFDPRQAISEIADNEKLHLDQAELVIALSSQKGIRKINKAVWNNRELFFRPGMRVKNIFNFNSVLAEEYEYSLSRTKGYNYAPAAERISSEMIGTGIYAVLPRLNNQETNFNISIAIQGGKFVRILPIGQDTNVAVSADWSSPSFQGAFLPVTHNITGKTFNAKWNISYLSRDIPLFWLAENKDWKFNNSLFGVDFFRQIDTYKLNSRAVKYAILYLIIPFLALFFMEIFAKRRIHPVPYMLAGIGNVIFYLLLLSFSEQMPFFLAYFSSAASVAIMMTLYSRSLIGSWQKSWYMGLVMSLSYIMLYAVLNAESYALLIGSVGAFAVTALIMYLTRKLDWYGEK